MKTIAEIVKENEPWTKHIVAALEARERERDAAERERVKGIVQFVLLDAKVNTKVLIDAIYPPPKPETLPAGWYWWKYKDDPAKDWACELHDEQVPRNDCEYHPWNDPPPEVTGKADVTQDADMK